MAVWDWDLIPNFQVLCLTPIIEGVVHLASLATLVLSVLRKNPNVVVHPPCKNKKEETRMGTGMPWLFPALFSICMNDHGLHGLLVASATGALKD
jgi:hypothetical protein